MSGGSEPISWPGFFRNMVPVLLGNIIGGSVLVGLVYYIIYLKVPDQTP